MIDKVYVSSPRELSNVLTSNCSKHIQLQDDIDLASLGQSNMNNDIKFDGVLDGNGYAFKNFSGTSFHLFDRLTKNSVVKNLTFREIVVKDSGNGLICNTLQGNLHNITIESCHFETNAFNKNGMIATKIKAPACVENLTISNCTFKNTTTRGCGMLFEAVAPKDDSSHKNPELFNIKIVDSEILGVSTSLISNRIEYNIKISNVRVCNVDIDKNKSNHNVNVNSCLLASTIVGSNIQIFDVEMKDISIIGFQSFYLFTRSGIDISNKSCVENITVEDIQFKYCDKLRFKDSIGNSCINNCTVTIESSQLALSDGFNVKTLHKLFEEYKGNLKVNYLSYADSIDKEPLVILENKHGILFNVYKNKVEIVHSNAPTIYQPFNIKKLISKLKDFESITVKKMSSQFRDQLICMNV